MDDLKKNASGYSDPTAHKAIMKAIRTNNAEPRKKRSQAIAGTQTWRNEELYSKYAYQEFT